MRSPLSLRVWRISARCQLYRYQRQHRFNANDFLFDFTQHFSEPTAIARDSTNRLYQHIIGTPIAASSCQLLATI